MKTVVNCDDFGVSHGVNQGIQEAFLRGIATGASIRTNGPAFLEAVKFSKSELKNMGLGIHLNLTDGKPHTKELTNNKGFYMYGFPFYLLHTTFYKGSKLLQAIEKELDIQFQMCISKKLNIDHVDGQDHIQMIPEIFEIICKLCRKYGVNKIRVSREPYFPVGSLKDNLIPFFNLSVIKQVILNILAIRDRGLLKKYGLKSTDSYYGVLYTNHMNSLVVRSVIDNALKYKFGSIEIALHPARTHHQDDLEYTSPFFSKYANLKNRDEERKTLLNPELKKFLQNKKVTLTTFNDI